MKRNLLKKFHGFIFPEQFIPHSQHIHKKRHSAFLGNIQGLRQPAHIVTVPSKKKNIYLERIVYVGCIHGGNSDIFHRLNILTKYPPDYLIFAGDITGSSEIEHLKKHFYDEKEKDLHSLYNKFEYFGDWAKTLPLEKRQKLLQNVENNAKNLLKIVKNIKSQGTKIYFLEGNWDNPIVSGIKAIISNDIKNIVDTQEYFRRHSFPFIRHLETLETKTSLHIFLPYIVLLHFQFISKYKVEEIKKQIRTAQIEGKTVIMVGHAEANWQIHHLHVKTNKVSGNRAVVINNFIKAMLLFKPDEVIYPHQHARLRDERGNLLDKNVKYILQIEKGSLHLINNTEVLNPTQKQIVTSYIPFGLLAEEDFIGLSTK